MRREYIFRNWTLEGRPSEGGLVGFVSREAAMEEERTNSKILSPPPFFFPNTHFDGGFACEHWRGVPFSIGRKNKMKPGIDYSLFSLLALTLQEADVEVDSFRTRVCAYVLQRLRVTPGGRQR